MNLYNNLTTSLKQSPLFENLEEKSFFEISPHFKKETHKKGSFLCSENNSIKRFYIIHSGRLKVYQVNPLNGREYTVIILAKGDLFDVLALLDGQKHEIMTEALDELEVFYTSMENMRNWIKIYPQLNQSILPYLGKRMRMLEQAAIDASLVDTSTRLAKLILLNINEATNGLDRINNLCHAELANMIGTTRAVVNRHLQELKKEGILSIERKHLHVVNLKGLKNKCILN